MIERIRKWNLLFTLGLGARSAAELLENLEEAGQEVPDWLPGEAVRYQAWRARKGEEKAEGQRWGKPKGERERSQA